MDTEVGHMLSDILFIIDNIEAMKICRVWKHHSEDPLIISSLTQLDPDETKVIVNQLKELGILLPGNKLGEDVEKYIDTYVVNHIKGLPGGGRT